MLDITNGTYATFHIKRVNTLYYYQRVMKVTRYMKVGSSRPGNRLRHPWSREHASLKCAHAQGTARVANTLGVTSASIMRHLECVLASLTHRSRSSDAGAC
jgi:hypothetical protein